MNLGRWAITVAACSGLALVVGIWVGGMTMRAPPRAAPPELGRAGSATVAADLQKPSLTSVILHVRMTSEINSYAVEEEVRIAYGAGVRTFLIDVALSWDGEGNYATPLRTSVLATLSDISITLVLDLNPPPSWRQAHPEDSIFVKGEPLLPLPWSAPWRHAAAGAVERLRSSLADTDLLEQIDGLALRGLSEGGWTMPTEFDRDDFVPAFRAWLMTTYPTVNDLNAAWQTKFKSFEALIAAPLPQSETTLINLRGDSETLAFRRFLSEHANDAVKRLTPAIKQAWGREIWVSIETGATFEPASGSFPPTALAALLSGPIDGVSTRPSVGTRGLGDVGAPTGPLDSTTYRGKSWFVLDDTRTGLEGRPTAGAAGLGPLLALFQRNAAFALMHGTEYVLSDPQGRGRFANADLWAQFAPILHAPPSEADTLPPDVLLVTSDIAWMYAVDPQAFLGAVSRSARDAALSSGASVRFVLLEDVLTGTAPAARVYLFCDAVSLDPEERDALHALLAAQRAAAIWLYAPGYFSADSPSTDNVMKTAKIKVGAYKDPAGASCVFTVDGNWIRKDGPLAIEGTWSPLLYIDDDSADVLAQYSSDKKAAVAVKFLDEGWTSMLVCPPALSAPLLRELLDIADIPMWIPGGVAEEGLVHRAGPDWIAHTASEVRGELQFAAPVDVIDVLNDARAWKGVRSIPIQLGRGETLWLRIVPSVAPTPVETAPEPR